MTLGWDGTERRETVIADERTKGNGKTVEAPAYLIVVGFVLVIALQAAALYGHAHLAAGQADAAEADERVACFVVGSVQGKPGTDLLTSCGFVKIGGK